MDLQALYEQVKESIDRVDLQKIWPGFSPLKFALYDQENCFFDGRYIEKTDAFCANTSISFRGEQIAIWMVSGEPDVIVLASKLVHEMFHGFQTLRGWDSWPDEMDALFNYRYDPENLSLKLRENELLCALLCRFDADSFRELLLPVLPVRKELPDPVFVRPFPERKKQFVFPQLDGKVFGAVCVS